MRLAILDSGHGFGTRALFALIRAVSRQPVLDVIKLVKYRADTLPVSLTRSKAPRNRHDERSISPPSTAGDQAFNRMKTEAHRRACVTASSASRPERAGAPPAP